jgi:hypothetical protein
MGKHNLRLSKRFTIEQCASRYEQLFENVISGKISSYDSLGRNGNSGFNDSRRRKKSKPGLAGAITGK